MTDEPETKIIVDNFTDYMQDRSEGLSYKQVAIKHGVPIGTVKSRINRGKAKLKAEGFV